MCTSKWWFSIGAVMACLAVVFGAFGAHGLENVLATNFAGVEKVVAGERLPGPAKYLRDFKTGAEYHMYHALGLMLLGAVSERRYNRSLAVAGTSFVLGILLFSGSLYLLVLTGETWMGAITPIGGVAFLVGWVALAIGAAPQSTCAVEPSQPAEEASGVDVSERTAKWAAPAEVRR